MVGLTTRPAANAPICQPDGALVSLPNDPEASGVAVAPGEPVRLFVVDDSGGPLTVLDGAGHIVGSVTVAGAEWFDWEDVSVARCGAATCLYVADIGDNNRSRRSIRLFRAPLPPANAARTAQAETFELTYPDGAHDAEALFETGGDFYVVTKEGKGAHIYKVPAFRPGGSGQLTPVAAFFRKQTGLNRITAAATSPDGHWIALRSNRSLDFFRPDDLLKGHEESSLHVDLTPLGEPQGEGIAFGADGIVYLVGEGGGKGRAGTFARLRCTLP
jgi:hypothetical protein